METLAMVNSLTERSHAYGYGGYGGGYYGGTPQTMRALYTEFGEQLTADLNDIHGRIDELTDELDSIDPNGDRINEQRVNEIVEEQVSPLVSQVTNSTEEIATLRDDVDESIDDVRDGLDAYDSALVDIDERLLTVEQRLDGLDTGGGGGISEDQTAAIDRELTNLRLIGRPKHRAMIHTGVPGGEYHPFGDWGQIITVHDDVQWRSAVVDVESPGVTKLIVEEMTYDEGNVYELGDVHATVELKHREAGVQEINPNISLPVGQYFVTRDTDMVVPMRRVMTDVDWDVFNQGNNVPVTVECSWRARANYELGTSEFEKYRDNNWHRRMYYFGDMEFSFMGDIDQSGG